MGSERGNWMTIYQWGYNDRDEGIGEVGRGKGHGKVRSLTLLCYIGTKILQNNTKITMTRLLTYVKIIQEEKI